MKRPSRKPHIVVVMAARPNFMKVAPLLRALRRYPVRVSAVHTGQHYDASMSGVFLRQLGMKRPEVSLEVGAGTPGDQLGRIVQRFEAYARTHRPDAVVVVGDVTSTLGAALAAASLGIPVAHVEAGLRSGDWSMPEERNRVLTDRLSRWLFAPSVDGVRHLREERIDSKHVFLVGNIMIDSLYAHRSDMRRSRILTQLGLKPRAYALVTLHRPSNVDDPPTLRRWMDMLGQLSNECPVIFPVHPRTRRTLESARIHPRPGVRLAPPQSYIDFLALTARARLVLTDSGGIQEETTCFRVPCLTLRANTERPITISHGTNQLAGTCPERVLRLALTALRKSRAATPMRRPPLWDGRTAFRIARILYNDVRRSVA